MALLSDPLPIALAILNISGADFTRHNYAVPRPLPEGGQRNGRPVWQPPILDYSANIGDEYDKQREAVLKHYKGDRVKTTKHMDRVDEYNAIVKYHRWAGAELKHATQAKRETEAFFWEQLCHELAVDYYDAVIDHGPADIWVSKLADGTWSASDNPRSASPTTASVAEGQVRDASGLSSLKETQGDDNSPNITDLPSPAAQPQIATSSPTQPALQIITPAKTEPNNEPASTSSPKFRCGCPCS